MKIINIISAMNTFTEKEKNKKSYQKAVNSQNDSKPEAQENSDSPQEQPQNPEMEALKEENNKLKLALAKSINDSKIMQKEIDLAKFKTLKNLILDLSESLDVFFIALNTLNTKNVEENKEFKDFAGGMTMVQKNMLKLLEKHQVTRIDPIGEEFDSMKHQAISQVESDKPKDTIVTVIKPGYVLKDTVISPAMVTVSKGE